MNTNNTNIRLLVGDPIGDPGEQRFITRLRQDLAERGIEALLFANFVTGGRSQRQVDLLVCTPHRVAQVEIKHLSESLPVRGPVNGPWSQVHPDGSARPFDKNFYRQAKDATYAVSDQMRALAKRGEVPPGSGFYKHIDTMVGIYPAVPDGSDLSRFEHVKALGYQDVLDRLCEPGPRPDWTPEHWDAFARHLGVYEEVEEGPDEHERRVGAEAVADYRRRSFVSFTAELPELIDLAVLTGEASIGRADVEARLRSGSSLAVQAASGAGKSFLARHVAARLTEQGEMVVWLRADEYDHGHLKTLLARATAPFSNARALELVHSAERAGVGVVVVVDGLNECSPDDQAELLEQLSAFRLRHPCGVLVTTTLAHHIPDGLDAISTTLASPDPEARSAILTVHGAVRPDLIPEAFTAPHDLAIAAQCEADLDPDATIADLHDAYIRTLSPSEAVRSALRAVATSLHDQMRTSAPLLDVSAHLGGLAGPHLAPELIDDTLASPLLALTPGRVRFRHELLRDFLVAEEVVRTATDSDDLATRLQQPNNRRVVHQALAIDPNPERVLDVLQQLADPKLFTAAGMGDFGAHVAAAVRSQLVALLETATMATGDAGLSFVPGPFSGEWVGARTWTAAEVAMLSAAGELLSDGQLIDEVSALLDRTDDLFATIIEAQDSDADPPTAALVGSTYVFSTTDRDRLPVSYVVGGCEHPARFLYREGPSRDVCTQLLAVPNPGWGRCYFAQLTYDPRTESDGAALPGLLRRSLALGAYHLKLHALWTVARFGAQLGPEERAQVVAVLEGYQPNNWALSSTVVEALAALGEIEPINTIEDIRADIARVLNNADHPDAAVAASGIVSKMFEPEDILGPFCEAVDTLDPLDRTRLLLLASSQAEDWSMTAGWCMQQLAMAAPCGDSELDGRLRLLFEQHAACPRTEGPMVHENLEVHVHALEGLARFTDQLPPGGGELTDDELAWRLVGTIVLNLVHPGPANPDVLWDAVLRTVPGAAVDVLASLQQADRAADFHGEPSTHSRLLEAYPDQIRQLLTWGLEHRDHLTSLFDRVPAGGSDPAGYAVRALGVVGNAETVVLLRTLATEPGIGSSAVDAIRRLNERLG